MYVLVLDDGTPYGPFTTLRDAVECDLKAMAVFALPDYQARARSMLHFLNLESVMERALVLIAEVDHLIVEMHAVIKPISHITEWEEISGLFQNTILPGEAHIEHAEKWLAPFESSGNMHVGEMP